MPAAHTDEQLLFTHLIRLWTCSRAPTRSFCLRLLLRAQLALRLTLIPPQMAPEERLREVATRSTKQLPGGRLSFDEKGGVPETLAFFSPASLSAGQGPAGQKRGVRVVCIVRQLHGFSNRRYQGFWCANARQLVLATRRAGV